VLSMLSTVVLTVASDKSADNVVDSNVGLRTLSTVVLTVVSD